MEKLWTTAEAAKFLGIGEGDVDQLVQEGQLTGYKLGGQFLRFRPEQVKGLKSKLGGQTFKPHDTKQPVLAWKERVRYFIYFYDFYILSFCLLIGVMVYLMTAG